MNHSDIIHINESLTFLKLFLEHQVSDLHSHIDHLDINQISSFPYKIQTSIDKIIELLYQKKKLVVQKKEEINSL